MRASHAWRTLTSTAFGHHVPRLRGRVVGLLPLGLPLDLMSFGWLQCRASTPQGRSKLLWLDRNSLRRHRCRGAGSLVDARGASIAKSGRWWLTACKNVLEPRHTPRLCAKLVKEPPGAPARAALPVPVSSGAATLDTPQRSPLPCRASCEGPRLAITWQATTRKSLGGSSFMPGSDRPARKREHGRVMTRSGLGHQQNFFVSSRSWGLGLRRIMSTEEGSPRPRQDRAAQLLGQAANPRRTLCLEVPAASDDQRHRSATRGVSSVGGAAFGNAPLRPRAGAHSALFSG